ncbi:MAG: dolichol-phosphate mannosyltransferase [Rhodospirillaceae bacterium]|nr:dolichol-phosphate mannosyltransferase [Rhodospirillaceae bacterium]|tara:strand:+ start:3369 stop:4097 length:729 start_codon:yes stop_codon:yes gene_type:complete
MHISPSLSVVIPVFNECANIRPLVKEITSALDKISDYEIIFVNDCSTDNTLAVITEMQDGIPQLRVITHLQRAGQSAGLRTGILAAKGQLIATLDGDGQNDPADIVKLLNEYKAQHRQGLRMITGNRVTRKDSLAKRKASLIANSIRKFLLKDDNPDTGCSLKLFERDFFLKLPYFDHMHRFLPALAKRENCSIIVVPVNHRHRVHGTSKYANLDRLLAGIPDLLGVMWLIRRCPRNLNSEE